MPAAFSSNGARHGAVHVYVGQDFWNLPFLTGRDPYSILYRSAPRASFLDRPIGLVVYEPGRGFVFSSAERPPALSGPLLMRARTTKPGLWTTLPIDGRLQHTYLFSDGQTVYGLSYPRLGAGRFAADLVEAVSAMSLVAALLLFTLLVLRTALRRPTLSLPSIYRSVVERFSLRLFVAFVGLAIVPVAVLQVVVRGFVRSRLLAEASDQALDRAAVARRAVETYSSLQRNEGAGIQAAVSDDALVFVAGLVRNDLAVFEGGRLRASSKRGSTPPDSSLRGSPVPSIERSRWTARPRSSARKPSGALRTGWPRCRSTWEGPHRRSSRYPWVFGRGTWRRSWRIWTARSGWVRSSSSWRRSAFPLHGPPDRGPSGPSRTRPIESPRVTSPPASKPAAGTN